MVKFATAVGGSMIQQGIDDGSVNVRKALEDGGKSLIPTGGSKKSGNYALYSDG